MIAHTGEVIGTRGQRTLRIVLAGDGSGYLVDNAFPVIGA